MKVGKIVEGEMLLIECEDGIEVDGTRTVEELYEEGFKDVCEVARPSGTAILQWQEFETCFIQMWEEPQEPDPDEISDSEALQIITQGE